MPVATQGSLLCDVCMKHSTNKLLHCDSKKAIPLLKQFVFSYVNIITDQFCGTRLWNVSTSKPRVQGSISARMYQVQASLRQIRDQIFVERLYDLE